MIDCKEFSDEIEAQPTARRKSLMARRQVLEIVSDGKNVAHGDKEIDD